MEFTITDDRISLYDPQGQELAFVSFLACGPDTVEIRSTVVSPSLRGQGVAGRLLETLAARLRAKRLRAVPVCSYAVAWFEKHPDQQDLLAAPSDGRD